ncbi:MAG: hypothetical protein KDI98_07175 [Hyphomicrobiaceae bacterium]|nr:hypothetical protein [Hyphomicrobiaceae bacterium]
MPFLFGLILAGAGAVIALRLLSREWDRVNADLDEVRREPPKTGRTVRAELDLERDPNTGVYRSRD